MIIFFVAGVVCISFIWIIVFQHIWAKGLSVRIFFDASAAYAGGKVNLVEEVIHEKKIPLPILEVAFKLPKGIRFQNTDNSVVSDFVYRRDIFSLLGNQKITRVLEVFCDKRGQYEIGRPSCNSFTLLHQQKYIKEMEWEKDVRHTLYVFAKRTDVSKILLLCQSILGETESERKLYEDPFCFSGIREYQITDSMKTINWKASAKAGGLVVNTYASVKSGQVMIYLDVEDHGILKEYDLLEESISVAATLSGKMLKSGLAVGLSINLKDRAGDGRQSVYLAPSKKRDRQMEIEKLLAESWEEEEVMDFGASLRDLKEEMVPVFISKNASEQKKEEMISFLGKEKKGLWVIPVEKAERCAIRGTDGLFIIPQEIM